MPGSFGAGARLPVPVTLSACGGIGVAGIGQLADISIGHVARRGKITGLPVGREDAGQASGVSLLLCGRAAGSRSRRRVMTALAALPACGLVLLPGRVSPSPGRLRGQLGAGGDVKLGEHVPQMGLHGLA